MNYKDLEFIKNVNDLGNPKKWAYRQDLHNENKYQIGDEFQLNFRRRTSRVETHACELPRGSVIILSQRSPNPLDPRWFLTHVVELVKKGIEDQPEWERGEWGVFRLAKVLWVTSDFDNPDCIPVDENVLEAEWVRQNSKAKRLENHKKLMSHWTNINNLRRHLEDSRIFGLPD